MWPCHGTLYATHVKNRAGQCKETKNYNRLEKSACVGSLRNLVHLLHRQNILQNRKRIFPRDVFGRHPTLLLVTEYDERVLETPPLA